MREDANGLIRCYQCKQHKTPGSFYADSTKPDGRAGRCKACDNERKTRRLAVAVAGRREIVRRAKTKPCADCGGTWPPEVMDLDHRPGEQKRFNVSNFARFPVLDVLTEIDKCDVVCANCHRLRTLARRTAAGEESPLVTADDT